MQGQSKNERKLTRFIILIILFLFFAFRFIYLGGDESPIASCLFYLIIILALLILLLNEKKINSNKEKLNQKILDNYFKFNKK